MWPFTPKTLYDRYSKLMKLIMSIEVTLGKRYSVTHLSIRQLNKEYNRYK